MRIPKTWIGPMARRVVDTLLKEEMIVNDVDVKALCTEVEAIVLEELMVEDRINDEVRNILRAHENSIDRGRLDYRKLFEMTKQKLIKERGVVV